MFEKNITLENYILSHIDEEDAILSELYRETHVKQLRSRMVSGHLQGQIIKMICQMTQPTQILEIGTFTGYSAICMAQATSAKTTIDTIDIDDEIQSFAQRFFKKAGFEHKITMHIGDAVELIPSLNKTYDLIFIDGDKRQYPKYYNLTLPLLKNGGFILADNVLWDGKVIEPLDKNDKYTKAILDFNNKIKEDTRVEKVILPIRDGIFIIRKK